MVIQRGQDEVTHQNIKEEEEKLVAMTMRAILRVA
jgi:hypothetical protein